uniref:Pentraxin n=1 Tax=Sphenodon punctatus TaxID=8508 RepID=A0A8D0G726_SPHPU
HSAPAAASKLSPRAAPCRALSLSLCSTSRVPIPHISCPDPSINPPYSDDFRVGFSLRTNYMYVKVKRTLHHEVFAFSICLWLKSSSAPGVGTPFSYSVPGQANELVLIEWGNNPMELLINDKVRGRAGWLGREGCAAGNQAG